MLQSEFYERTRVNLTAEEYIKIETLYNEVEMDKDEFCQQWLKLRDNQLLKEAIDAFYKSQKMVFDINKLEKQLEEERKRMAKIIENTTQKLNDDMENFARRIIRANNSDGEMVEDVIEEEFGLDFICKVKLENGVALQQFEIEHLIKKL